MERMMERDAREKIEAAASAITTAVAVLRFEMPTMQAFLEECRMMESVGPILNPTLYRDPERRAVSALLEPMFRAAADFVRIIDAQLESGKSALQTVSRPAPPEGQGSPA